MHLVQRFLKLSDRLCGVHFGDFLAGMACDDRRCRNSPSATLLFPGVQEFAR